MEIVSAQQFDLTYLTAFGEQREIGEDRSVGLHVSDVIRDIDNRLIHRGQRLPYDQLTSIEQKRMGFYTELGFIWEEVVTHYFRKRMEMRGESMQWVTQQEIEMDDLFLTPDGLDLDSDSGIECKATWVASWKIEQPEKYFWSWFTQMKAYAKALGVTTYRLFVFWVCGDYKSSGPIVMEYHIRFSPQEIEENWAMLVNHAKTMPKIEA